MLTFLNEIIPEDFFCSKQIFWCDFKSSSLSPVPEYPSSRNGAFTLGSHGFQILTKQALS